LRPCTPDDLPLIGNLQKYPNVFLNGGHGGRGTTHGLATSFLVSELLMNPSSELREKTQFFSPKRFNI